MRGGTGKIIPEYIEPINTPYKTNNQIEIEKEPIVEPVAPEPQIMDNKPVPQGRSYIPPSNEVVEEVKVVVENKTNPKQQPNKKPDGNVQPQGVVPQPYSKQITSQHPKSNAQIYDNIPAVTNIGAVPSVLPKQTFNVTSPYLPPQLQSQFDAFVKNAYVPFIYKDYHINMSGPNDNHLQASMIYEDALPSASIYTSFASLQQRNSLCKYARSMFIKQEEGEDVNFNGGENSLNSRLKLIELNPYNTNYFSNNPYKGLPSGLLIYRSCYPIMYDKANTTVQCQKNSVGVNVRIYKVTIDAYRSINPNFQMPVNKERGLNLLPSNVNYSANIPQYSNPALADIPHVTTEVNTVGDLFMAPTMRDYIVGVPRYIPEGKTTVTNAIPEASIAPVIPRITEVLNNLPTSSAPVPTISIQTEVVNPKSKYEFDVWREVFYYQFIRDSICKPMVCPNFVESYCYFISKESDFNFDKNTMKQSATTPNGVASLTPFGITTSAITAAKTNIDSSKKAVVMLTESPNYNIYTWASNSYVRQNNIQKQTYTGYKSDPVWLTVIAQMLIVFYVMFKFEFTYNEMIFQNNFYIKDLNISTDSNKYWVYRIDGFDYYIPNFGHLLLFDSDYHDLDEPKLHKVIGKQFGDDSNVTFETIMKNASKCTDNVLGPEFAQVNGVQPSSEVIDKLNRINGEIKTSLANPLPPPLTSSGYNNAFKGILHSQLINYLHNRVGTVLRDNEVNFIRKEDPKPLKIGAMVVNEYQVDKYRFVIIKDHHILTDGSTDADNFLCYIRANFNEPTPAVKLEITTAVINKAQLYNYSENETIKQDAKVGEVASTGEIIETYII